eukprot:COSAG02_NODE_6703_length_3412_cov_2.188651_1_plen_906_part_10
MGRGAPLSYASFHRARLKCECGPHSASWSTLRFALRVEYPWRATGISFSSSSSPASRTVEPPPANTTPVKEWSVDDVVEWATQHRQLVAAVAERLRAEDVDGAALIELSSDEIKNELKLTLGLRKALERAIRELVVRKRPRDEDGDEEGHAQDGATPRPAPALRNPATIAPPSTCPTMSSATAATTVSADAIEEPISLHICDVASCVSASKPVNSVVKIDPSASLQTLKQSIAELKGVTLHVDNAHGTMGVNDGCIECTKCICRAALALDGGAPDTCACKPGALPARFNQQGSSNCLLCRGGLEDAAPASSDNSLVVGQCGCVLHKRCAEGWLRPKQVQRKATGVSFQIFARASRTVTLDVFPSDTLEDVAMLIQEKLSIPANSMVIMHSGRQLKRGQTLAALNVQKEATLMVNVTGRAMEGDTNTTLVMFQSGSTTCPVCSEHWRYMQLTGTEIGEPSPIRVMFPGEKAPLLIAAAEPLRASKIKEILHRECPDELQSRFLMSRGRPLFNGAWVEPGSYLYLCGQSKHEMMVKVHIHQIDSADPVLPVNIATTATCLKLKQEVQGMTGKQTGSFALVLPSAPDAPLRDADLINDILMCRDDNEPRLTMVESMSSKLVLDLATTSHILVSTIKSERQSLRDWGIASSSIIYASWRAADEGETYANFKENGHLTTFTASSAWSPSIEQTPRGMSMFLSALHVLTETLSDDQDSANAVISFLAALAPFPPAIICFKLLIDKADVTEAHQAALSQVLYTIMRSQLPASVRDGQVFEGSIVSFAWLYQFAKIRKVEPVKWEDYSLACELSYERLVDPVTFPSLPGERFSRANCVDYLPGGSRFRPDGRYTALAIKDAIEDIKTSSLLLAFPEKDEAKLLVSDLSSPTILSSKMLWEEAQRRVKQVPFFRI